MIVLLSVQQKKNLSLNGLEVFRKLTLLRDKLDVTTIGLDETLRTSFDVFGTVQGSETPLLGDNDLLLTGELVLTTSQSFNDNSSVGFLGTNGEDDLTNVDTS